MTVALARRADIDLAAFRRAAWEEEPVTVDAGALAEVDRRRRQFLHFIDAHPDRRLYGVNVHAGDGSDRPLTEADQRDYARGMQSAVAFGPELLPRRVVRGILLARLANMIEGHSGVRSDLVEAVAAQLDGRPVPTVPRYGHGGSGEIVALGWVFGNLGSELDLQVKESMALINGSPCASALIADATLVSERVVARAEAVFGLAAAAFGVSPAIYHSRLDELWGDPHQARALARLREQLDGAGLPGDEEHPQPPVSFRILPRVLGNAHRVVAQGREVAETALRAVSDNPTFLFDDDAALDIVSTGGFHSGTAAPAIDALTFTLADFTQLAQHELHRLQTSRHALPRFDSTNLGILQMAASGYAEEARGACVPTLLGLGGWGQNDVPSPAFIAYNRFDRVQGFVLGSLACLAAVAGQSFAQTGREVPAALSPLLADVLEICPPIEQRRSLGPDLAALAEMLGAGVPD
jgi:histidine ammonia-lyase